MSGHLRHSLGAGPWEWGCLPRNWGLPCWLVGKQADLSCFPLLGFPCGFNICYVNSYPLKKCCQSSALGECAQGEQKILFLYLSYTFLKFIFKNRGKMYTVDPWTTRVWTGQVHLYRDFFSIVTATVLNHPRLFEYVDEKLQIWRSWL